ncbi:MAG: hypothetical protein J1F02_02600 [Lachnospiraceae bacterium]|nr:hypothetical protein [Lachnospiraceae bacterium]
MNTICIIELKNQQEDYAKCLDFIKTVECETTHNRMEQLAQIVLKLPIQIGYTQAGFSPRYIEEPIDMSERGKRANVSVQDKHSFADSDKHKLLSKKNSITYHLRIHFNGQDDYGIGGEIINLQYLAMLLKYVEPITFKKEGIKRRLTVFMVPLTGTKFPFEDVHGNIDYDTYDFTSQYLRLLSKRYTGVIYGVKQSASGPVVTSLDFYHSKQKKTFFPLLLIDNQKYNQLFVHPINDDLEELFSLRSNKRFRNAGSDNPNIAMKDYIAETDVKRIRSVVGSFLESWEQNKQKIQHFLKTHGEMCLMHFSLFAFMLSEQKTIEEIDLYSYEDIWQIAKELSQGLRQIVQNSLQHTQSQECFLAFYLHVKGKKEEKNMFYERIAARFPEVVFAPNGRDEALEVIISDINEQEDMIDNFVANLQYEIEEQRKILENSSVLPGHIAIIKERKRLAIRNFFSEYEVDDPIHSWMLFRKNDLIAHVGLGQFAQVAGRCNAAVKVISSKQSILTDEKRFYYKSYAEGASNSLAQMMQEKEKCVIPGTQFSILVPVGALGNQRRRGISQLRQRNHVAENYKSFATFLEYKERRINVPVTVNANTIGGSGNSVLDARKKYVLVQLWTRYWEEKFEEQLSEHIMRQKNGIFSKYVINYDFSQAVDITYFKDYDRIEVCLKGIIGALEVIREKGVNCYLAMTNLPDGFIDSFRRICILLSVKSFPSKLQLCLQENCKKNGQIKRVIMLGDDFSQAISNSYVLSMEQGVDGFDKGDCKRAAELKSFLIPKDFLVGNSKKENGVVGAMPFDVILGCSDDDSRCFFERQLKKMAEGSLDEEIVGYKLKDTHMRLGSKVHIESFYEMSFLFYRTTIANRLAFIILRHLLKRAEVSKEIDLLTTPILFYGYASYSKAILTSITEILQEYRIVNKSNKEQYVAFASFQHNLMLESEETQMYFGLQKDNFLGRVDDNNRLILNENTKIVQIVPISSTLTTFEKMWKKFESSVSTKEKISLVENYTVFWVVDTRGCQKEVYLSDIEKKYQDVVNRQERSNKLIVGYPSSIEEKYWEIVIECEIVTKLTTLKSADNPVINFFIRSKVIWHDPLKCEVCYPKYVIDEVPLVETDATSTVPTQQIRYKNYILQKPKAIGKAFCERFIELADCVSYDHICRRQNHYQFYIDTQKYFYKVKNYVKNWLRGLEDDLDEDNVDPILHIIFSPEHNTNVGFAQYVNTHYFKGLAEIVSINVDKQFRSNFVCEHAVLKQMIDRLYLDNSEEGNCPVKFYFVDDTIITGETFEKANGLLQSLIPTNTYPTNLFCKIFLLVDRLSSDTKKMYVSNPENNFLSFLHIDVSNTRTHGDSCIGCKLEQDARRMFKRSATRNMAHHWSEKIKDYKKKEYDNRSKISQISKKKSYYMLAFSHVMQNIMVKQGRCSKLGEAYDVVLNVAGWLIRNKDIQFGNAYGFEKLLLQNKGILGIQALFKTICRPFFSYDFTIKRQFYTFFILLAELFMGMDKNKVVPKCLEKKGNISYLFEKEGLRLENTEILVKLIKSNLYEKKISELEFFQRYILEGLTDMGSTYVMRKQTLQKTYLYVSDLRNNLDMKEQMDFWNSYEANIHRLVSNNTDETKELWLEYLYMTGEEYQEFDKECKEETFTPVFLYTKITGNAEVKVADKIFYQFCHNLFLQNTGINFDNLEEKVKETKDVIINEDKNFNEYWRQMYCLTQFKNPFMDSKRSEVYNTKKEEILFDFLRTSKNKGNHFVVKSVNKWYQQLLNHIVGVICDKYHVRDVNIALLTETMNGDENSTYIQAMDIVEEKLNSCKIGLPETKYCIKQRVVDALSSSELFDLEGNGYFLDEDLGQEEIQRPYVIAFFDNPKAGITEKEMNWEQHIARVFLYISIAKQGLDGRTKFILRLILREVMTYRNRILRCLQKDFAGDLYARYARKNGEQNILSHEKAHSHNTTADDMITLEVFQDKEKFKKDYEQINMEKAKDWLLLRNYTNGQIAKIFNRSFNDFHEEKNGSTDSPMLYIPQNIQYLQPNPFKCILRCFSDFNLKNMLSNSWDRRLELLNEVIELRYEESLENAVFIQGKQGEYYNLEYFRCILIDMLISAIKYESTRPDFLLRIDRLLEIKSTLKEYELPEYSWMMKDRELRELYERLKKEKCTVMLYREKSPYEGIDYLIVCNSVNTQVYRMDDWEKKNESIEHRLQDPLDFADGHMSLLAIKRYIENLGVEYGIECVFRYKCEEGEKGEKQYYFENCLPVLKREG